jgi:phospholipid/cholesterol/gamma-HCH transport system substrate-binding protein
MSVQRTERQLRRIAVIGLAGMALVFLVAVNFQRLPLVGGGTGYRAEFTDAAGLVAGEEVRVAGIKVGTVTGIELGEGAPARILVSFTVKGVELGARTRAGIEVKTLLGQHYLSVTPAGEGRLEAGSLIPLDRTTTPVNIVPVFQQLTTTSQDLDTDQVAKAFDVLSTTLTRTAPEMGETLRGLSRLSRSVSVRDAEIRELFDRTSAVSGVVAARDRDVARLLTDTTTVLAELDRRRQTVAGIIDGTVLLARQLSGLVADNKAQLAPALAQLNAVLDVLRANRRNIDDAIRLAEVYGREFVNVGGSGRFFDASIKVPHGFALCPNGGLPLDLDGIVGPILSQLNGAVNDSDKPCLPLGPAAVTP